MSVALKKWLCIVCGWIYDEALGWPDDGIAPGTRWEDIPDDWLCPECKVGKADFEMIEISEAVIAVAQTPPLKTPETFLPPAQPVVIIGSGYAGYGLAQALRKADPAIEIRVLTQEDGHNYSKPALSIALAQGRAPSSLATESPMAIEERLGIRVYPHCRVERIDTDARRLFTNLGEMVYGQLILASGASPVRVPVEGASEALISVNNLHDYHGFRARLVGVKRVAILGDGLIGCEFANDLAASGYEVQVIGLGAWPMERLLPRPVGIQLQDVLSNLGVRWHLGTTLQRVEPRASGFELTLANGENLEADIVLSAIGLRPNLELARAAGIKCDRGILTDAYLQTSQPGVYALGDCIEVDGQLLPYLAPINQGIQALVKTITGAPTTVSYPLMPVMVKTPAAPLSLLIPPPGTAGQWRCDATEDGLSAAFHDEAGAVRGFVLLGRQAQGHRSTWLQRCQDTQQSVA
ncbi:FAD-dependent oxidoreductase [Pseudomonas sp. RC10]|uniref:FAD-dependent oxidoreductase n=2 Tax=Pseudomonas bambusae TaxID=3139142 RepID=UPI003138ADDE